MLHISHLFSGNSKLFCGGYLLKITGSPKIVPSSALLVPEDGICDPSKHQEPHTKQQSNITKILNLQIQYLLILKTRIFL